MSCILLFILLYCFTCISSIFAKNINIFLPSLQKLSIKGMINAGCLSCSNVLVNDYLSVLLDLEYDIDTSEKYSGFKSIIRLHPYIYSTRFIPSYVIRRLSIEIFDKKFGLLEIGKHFGVDSSMKVDAFSAVGMTRDFLYRLIQLNSIVCACSGEYYKSPATELSNLLSAFANNISNTRFWSCSKLANFSIDSIDKRGNFKLSYISRDFLGFKFGISYTPNFDIQQERKEVIFYSDILQCSIFYVAQINDVAYKFSVSYKKSDKSLYKDAAVYSSKFNNPSFSLEFGTNIAYMGLTIGASTKFLDEFYNTRDPNYKFGNYSTLGSEYRIGKFRAWINYFNIVKKYSNGVLSKLNGIVFGFSYKFLKNLSSVIQVFRLNLSFNNTANDSYHDYIVSTGIEFKF